MITLGDFFSWNDPQFNRKSRKKQEEFTLPYLEREIKTTSSDRNRVTGSRNTILIQFHLHVMFNVNINKTNIISELSRILSMFIELMHYTEAKNSAKLTYQRLRLIYQLLNHARHPITSMFFM